MKIIIQRADERGVTELGWLHSRHSFSFGQYYNPMKERFGLLRVLNDDIVEPGEGFGTHAHDNMEIISIVLKGQLKHRDSLGNGSVINEGEVQVMSAGTGVTHSEFNPSESDRVNFLQLWIFPRESGIKPRYDQRKFNISENEIIKIVSGEKSDDALYINQDASISFGRFNEKKNLTFKIDKKGYGAYLFILEGSIILNGDTLKKRDAAGISETDGFIITTDSQSEFIIINVPMN
jgi:hypothetical protein